jgi:hypothetical protein
MEARGQLSKSTNQISALELKQLLHEIKDRRPDISIRFRLLGQMWQKNFCRIFMIAERGAVLIDEATNAAEIIPDLAEVVQFEIDGRFHHYQPNYHYSVTAFEPEAWLLKKR